MSEPDAALDALPCGVLTIASDRTILACNRHVIELLCVDGAAALVGLNVREIVTVATRILLDSYVYPMLLEAGAADEIQLTLKSPGNERRVIVANFRMNADGTTSCALMGCAARDQLYTELLETRDELQRRTEALARLNARIQGRRADLQSFCESLSHDFAGPLDLIHRLIDTGLADLRDSGVEAPDEFELFEAAGQNAKILIGLTQGLIQYLVADVTVALDERVDLEDVVSAVLALRQDPDAAAPVVHRDALPTVLGSAAQLQVLFKNLIDNAIKYNERTPEITISHAPDATDAGRVVVSVTDNGIGMAANQLHRVFDPFVRLNGGERHRGSGLGLSLVRQMVANHGGEIAVESEPGEGSTFHVTLPLGALDRRDVESGSTRGPTASRPKRPHPPPRAPG